MDYKKIIKSQKLRFFILRLLKFIPDSLMLRLQYRIKLGRKLNLKAPERFTEKIQWYKLNYRNPLMGRCVDKYAVREYVKSKGLENTLTVLYGVYDNAEDIDFTLLPQKFVIKSTDGGGGENIFICKDKSHLDISQVVKTISGWKNKKNIDAGREWAYTCIKKSRYVVEEYLENEEDSESPISDYKFFCFSGKPYCIAYDIDRYTEHKRNFYDIKWNNLNILSDCPNFSDICGLYPEGLDEMLKAAEMLSTEFSFVRVDLYYVNGRVYFGELTFYPWSGYVKFAPDEFDFTLGRQFITDKIIKEQR